ncbi:zinc finger-containing ubiquitin peptidase 1 [Anaeramoeba ignava]|uniref:Zinc finger-containing ubiquitin peptidase 1 n=1 Tax=Anaeramoeba ignava TaxID=1746090 RepID=A0A9Q0R472_ANAIG|nr:zinc finger-containing ubiquitin peptidase 1 [Anaeramoeba ignava]
MMKNTYEKDQKSQPDCTMFLSTNTNHFQSTKSDYGWACGYKNIQMMLTHLYNYPVYKEIFDSHHLNISSISQLQDIIKKSWKEGFDPEGAKALNYLSRKNTWIGTTEFATFFQFFGIPIKIYEFPKRDQILEHSYLFDYVKNYYITRQQDKEIPPLILQHSGHSRSIVGYVEIRSQNQKQQSVLLYDPWAKGETLKYEAKTGKLHDFHSTIQEISEIPQFQILEIDSRIGHLMTKEEREKSKIIKGIEIPNNKN